MGGCVPFVYEGAGGEKPVIFCGDLNVAHKEIDLKTRNPIGKMRDSPMRRGGNSPSLRRRDLSIHSGIFTQTKRGFIPGGHIALAPGRKTRGGGLTISLYRML